MKIRSSLNGWNGYSVEEVDEFLDQVTEELEKKCKEVSALNKELEQIKKELNDFLALHIGDAIDAYLRGLAMSQKK